jgi:nicotinamidase-related amidase
MQRECCVEWPTAIGEYDEELAQVFQRRMEQIVIPNTQRLLKLFREKDLLVIYLTLDVDGIISQIAPNPERLGHSNWWEREAREFVLAKYSSGAFATSALDNVLRENDIATVFFVGVDTCGCVDATITEAYDRCYQTILIDDACCSSRPELHDAVVKIWTYKGFVRSSDQVIREYPWNGWVEAK